MGYSFREPGFVSQHSHGSSKLFITPVPEDLVPSSLASVDSRHTRGAQKYMQAKGSYTLFQNGW